jgi:hypothetical protein
MKFKWYRAHSAAEIVDDLLRAFEYAEARAATDLQSLAASAQDDSASSACRARGLGDTIETSGPPYGHGI